MGRKGLGLFFGHLNFISVLDKTLLTAGRKAEVLPLHPLSYFSAPLATFGSSVMILCVPTCLMARWSAHSYPSAPFHGYHLALLLGSSWWMIKAGLVLSMAHLAQVILRKLPQAGRPQGTWNFPVLLLVLTFSPSTSSDFFLE